jgi:hypothetical protein
MGGVGGASQHNNGYSGIMDTFVQNGPAWPGMRLSLNLNKLAWADAAAH